MIELCYHVSEGGVCMPNYQAMYILLCAAIDNVIDPLEQIPAARPQAALLSAALLQAEELYISSEDAK